MAPLGSQLANRQKERIALNWKRAVSRGISEAIAISRMGVPPLHGLRVLAYHAIGSPVDGDRLGLYSLSPALFGRQMEALSSFPKTGYCGFLEENIPGDGLQIALTFDDGYRDNLYVAAPLLQKYKIPFTVFVTTSFVKNRTAPFLSPEELRELASLPGATIGAHGSTHVSLTLHDDPTVRREVGDSKHYLEDLLGKPVDSMSYPHGAVSPRIRDIVEDAGYRAAGTSLFDINRPGADPLLLARTDIHSIDTLRVFRQKLHGDWDWSRCKGSGKFRETKKA